METSLKHHGSSGSGGGDSAGAAHETVVSGAEPHGFPFIQPQLCAAICVRRGKDLVRGLTSLCLLVSCKAVSYTQYVSRMHCAILEFL